MENKEAFLKAVKELRKLEQERTKQVKFDQSIDLLVNLKNFDIKRASVNTTAILPHIVREKKVAGFLEKKSKLLDTITKEEFEDFKDKKKMKKLVENYDFFISSAKLMPSVASTFGRALGPAGKMPTPQLGVIMLENEDNISSLLKRINNIIRIKAKEPSIKLVVAKQSFTDESIVENALVVYNEIFKSLLKGKENIKNVLIKTTMGKPVKVTVE
jgi:large subunit ribosomal protein L1